MEPRAKSFKAISKVQPIKKQIDQTLIKLEEQKRHFLAFQRQQAYLKETIQKKRKQLNDLKFSQFTTKTHISKTQQNINVCHNVDRAHQNSINSLNQLKTTIDLKRKKIFNYKKFNTKLTEDIQILENKIQDIIKKINHKQNKNQMLKNQLMQYRLQHHKNVAQFQKSYFNITRQDFKAENQRKKTILLQKSFLNEELRTSRLLNFQNLSQVIKNSGVPHNEGNVDLMTQSVPLIKHRVKRLIYFNKDKLKICQNYRKFGEGLVQMFGIIKQYKAREDLQFLSQQFVAKERQIQQLQEYVSQLEGSIHIQKQKLHARKMQDQIIKSQLEGTINTNKQQQHYQQLNKELQKQIQSLKNQQKQDNLWFQNAGKILAPLIHSELPFNSTNALALISQIQENIDLKKGKPQTITGSKSSPKQIPHIQVNQVKAFHNELLPYNKMRQIAEDFVRNKLLVPN